MSVKVDVEDLVPLFYEAHPRAVRHELSSGTYLVAEPDMDPMTLFHSNSESLNISRDELLNLSEQPTDAAAGRSSRLPSRVTSMKDLPYRVVALMRTAPHRWQKRDVAWMDEEEGLLAELKVSKKRLKGLSKAAGTGPVIQCINRIVEHFIGFADTDDRSKYERLAAIRLTKMSSAKTIVEKEGEYFVEDRH